MTAPIPEERDEPVADLEETPPGEHDDELPDAADGGDPARAQQEENAATTMDQPSQ